MKKRVIVACEYSATVRSAFANRGWDAWSCDLLDSEIPGKHYKGNIFDFLKNDSDFDLMIAHPPCTFLSSVQTFMCQRDEKRVLDRITAADFFMKLYSFPIKHIAVENPAGVMKYIFRPADQFIHPWFFGDKKMKRTGLWLKNLPLLKYNLEDDLFEKKTAAKKPDPIEINIRKSNGKLKKRYDMDSINSKYFLNGHERSRFSPFIANAMAEQWGSYIENLKIGNNSNKQKKCKKGYYGCPYHACMSNDCQKKIVMDQGIDWGKGYCKTNLQIVK